MAKTFEGLCRNLFMRPPFLSCFAVTVCLSLFTRCSSTRTATSTVRSPAGIWAVAWGASPESAAAVTGGAEQTFRSFFYPTVSGTNERVRFSNYFGTASITIGAARLSIAATPPAVDATHDVALSFGGSPSVTIAPGAEVVSDAVNMTYTFGQKLAVSAYVKGNFLTLSQHYSDSMVNYSSAANTGETTADTVGTSFTQPIAE